jgi:lactoylglutathione lyase
VKTILTACRVRDINHSAAFYVGIGYQEIGRAEFEGGTIRMWLNLPGDGEVVPLELVYEPEVGPLEIGNGFSHLAIQVDDLAAFLSNLSANGIEYDGPHLHGEEHDTKTAFVHDPDGYRIEIVQWPPGHPAEMTRADFTTEPA